MSFGGGSADVELYCGLWVALAAQRTRQRLFVTARLGRPLWK